MAVFTVIGVRSVSSGELMVAGVVAGSHAALDSDVCADELGEWQRYASSTEADNADHAAYLVTQEVEADQWHEED